MWNTIFSLIGTAWAFLKSKYRLIIEYGLIVVVIVLGAFVVAEYYKSSTLRKEVTKLNGEITSLAFRGASQEARIFLLEEFRNRDQSVLNGLAKDQQSYLETSLNLIHKIEMLGKTNATVSSYLNMPVPFPLACLLDGTCSDGTNNRIQSTDATGSIATAMQETGDKNSKN